MNDRYADPHSPRALDAARRANGRALNAEFNTVLAGATNLVTKAAQALRRGEDERASRLIARVCSIPDDPDEGNPSVCAATQLVYDAVTDDLEHAHEDDDAWLDAALTTWESAPPAGRRELASILREIADIYTVSATEKRRIRNRVPDAPRDPDFGLTADSSVADKEQVVRSLLLTFNAYREAFDDRSGLGQAVNDRVRT